MPTHRSPAIAALIALVTFALHAHGQGQGPTFRFGNTEGFPLGWEKIGFGDSPTFRVVQDDQKGRVLELRSSDQSGGIARDARSVDLEATPWLTFAWKVTEHPNGGLLNSSASEQAVIIYVDFPRPGPTRRVLAYVFDPGAPVNTWHDDNTLVARVRAKVLDSGNQHLGEWRRHSVNVLEDFKAQFPGKDARIQGISIYCNSNHTHSKSRGYCTELKFSADPAR